MGENEIDFQRRLMIAGINPGNILPVVIFMDKKQKNDINNIIHG
jgi:hypothetical protein